MLPEVTLYFDRLQSRLDAVKESLEEIGSDEEQLNWRPEGDCPSIFSLAAFIAMNTDYWIGHAIGNLAEPPGFDNVLEEAHGVEPSGLKRRLDAARETTRQILLKIDRTSLDKIINLNDEPTTARECILQALEDAAERYGEIRTYMLWLGSE